MAPRHLGRSARRTTEQVARQRHHVGDRDRRPPDRRLRHPRARLRPGAERLRPPLHLLHHPLWPRQFTLGARRRGGRTDQAACRIGLRRGRADRRRSHLLGRRSAGHAATRRPRDADPETGARPCAAADLLDRFDRGRRRPDAGHRHRAAADAASAPVPPGRRRPDPEADEAAPFARRRHRLRRRRPPPAPRHHLRRRHHRRLPDRDRRPCSKTR